MAFMSLTLKPLRSSFVNIVSSSRKHFGSIALSVVTAYLSAAFMSVVIAHIFMIAKPASGWGQRTVAPLAKGLEFLDAHWKPILILIGIPFLAPMAEGLIGRVRKAWGLEFEPEQKVTLEAVGGAKEKMSRSGAQ